MSPRAKRALYAIIALVIFVVSTGVAFLLLYLFHMPPFTLHPSPSPRAHWKVTTVYRLNGTGTVTALAVDGSGSVYAAAYGPGVDVSTPFAPRVEGSGCFVTKLNFNATGSLKGTPTPLVGRLLTCGCNTPSTYNYFLPVYDATATVTPPINLPAAPLTIKVLNVSWLNSESLLEDVYGLALDASGNLYVSEATLGDVFYTNPTGMSSYLKQHSDQDSASGYGGHVRIGSLMYNFASITGSDAYGSFVYFQDVALHGNVSVPCNGASCVLCTDCFLAGMTTAQGVSVDGISYLGDFTAQGINQTYFGSREAIVSGQPTTGTYKSTAVAQPVCFYNSKQTGTGHFSSSSDTTALIDNTTNMFLSNRGFLNQPKGIAFDRHGNFYIAEETCIRVIPAGATMSVVYAGNCLKPGHYDSPLPDQTRFGSITALVVDESFNLYVSDTGNNVIRVVQWNGNSTVLGQTRVAGILNVTTIVTASALEFSAPQGLALMGNSLYVADTGNHVIKQLFFDGTVKVVAGTTGVRGAADGADSSTFSNPTSLAVDHKTGNLYVGDDTGVRRMVLSYY